ncbi:hypothetical protein F4803DRAFT_574995 [Xylaria telfairii]|nr:hypothetical protein F4803DRAFT_574995 [Xylaria telfairii]
MSAENPPKSATQVRERGNELYKKGALNEGKTRRFQVPSTSWAQVSLPGRRYSHHHLRGGGALDPSDPLPLSNLSAAYFEAGSYVDSIEAAQKALGKLPFAADTQSGTAQKLLVRSAKSRLHLAQVDDAKELVDKIIPGEELDGLVYALRDAGALG